jgi:Holliday junction resolvase RusA-like endonuclease
VIIICFEVLGAAEAQGSMRAFMPKGWNRPVLTSTNKKLKAWRQEVAQEAELAMREMELDGCIAREVPIRVEASFYFTRPKSVKKNIVHKTTRSDLDKYARGLLDAMSGTVYADDAQVSQLWVNKFLADKAKTVVKITTIGE